MHDDAAGGVVVDSGVVVAAAVAAVAAGHELDASSNIHKLKVLSAITTLPRGGPNIAPSSLGIVDFDRGRAGTHVYCN